MEFDGSLTAFGDKKGSSRADTWTSVSPCRRPGRHGARVCGDDHPGVGVDEERDGVPVAGRGRRAWGHHAVRRRLLQGSAGTRVEYG